MSDIKKDPLRKVVIIYTIIVLIFLIMIFCLAVYYTKEAYEIHDQPALVK